MATSHKYDNKSDRWTYGAELEFADWPRNEKLPKGMAVDDGNYTTVNSNGVAADPKGELYPYGGELLTAPSEDPLGPTEQMVWAAERWPAMTANYRIGLNVHVRVPGLRDDLRKLKQLQAFVHRVMPSLLPIIDPIPVPSIRLYKTSSALAGAHKNQRTRKKDHHTLLPDWRLELAMKARTPKEFFEAEAIHLETGAVHWAISPRTCINLRQMLQTDSIEFRHFPMPRPNRPDEMTNATLWCKMFLEAAFSGARLTANDLLEEFRFGTGKAWPTFLLYEPWLDQGWHYTTRHYHKPDVVTRNIKDWLEKNEGRVWREDVGDYEPNRKTLPERGPGPHFGDGLVEG